MATATLMPATRDNRWTAIVTRDAAAVGRFVYAVRSTGVYCHPNCPSRLPNRKNVKFFDTPLQAEAAGYRACRRCRPNQTPAADPRLVRACRFIEQSEAPPSLDAIAAHVALSPHYLHRLFRKHLGVTPKQYSSAKRVERLKNSLASGESVTRAIYQAGYATSGRCYAEATGALGMTPKQYRDRGEKTRIRFAIVGCRLGRMLVAVTEKGVCQIALGDDDSALRADLLARLPAAEQVRPDPVLAELLAAVVAFVDAPGSDFAFPLDIRGTAFQQKVWKALQSIPPGETRSYTEVANSIGRPEAVRAVASAIAANELAVVIPCHRVIHKASSLSGYRWGKERKKSLLAEESRAAQANRHGRRAKRP